MSFTLKVHERDKKNSSVISKLRPYIRLSERDQVPIFFQEGQFWYENGKAEDSPPAWAIEQMNNLDKKSQQQVKYRKMEVKDNGND